MLTELSRHINYIYVYVYVLYVYILYYVYSSTHLMRTFPVPGLVTLTSAMEDFL